MEKRKLKFNILDIAILVAIICSVAVLIFRDVIHDAFGEPEIVELAITLDLGETNIDEFGFDENEAVEIFLDEGDGATVLVSVNRIDENSLDVVCKGYKKLGRFYTENGDLISIASVCEMQKNDGKIQCEVESVEING